jgi:hypothetical protein
VLVEKQKTKATIELSAPGNLSKYRKISLEQKAKLNIDESQAHYHSAKSAVSSWL